MDTAGRLLIPQNLKDIAAIDKDIVLFAKVKVIEIWDKRKYKQLFETLSANDFSSLANEVMVKPPTV
jgi:MraZ protein